MSLPIYVDAYSGFKASERPIRFWLDPLITDDGLKGVYEIESIEDRWYDPNAEYFRVRIAQGRRYILRCDLRDHYWTLLSGFDGGELLARPGIELVMVDSDAILRTQGMIVGCERCRMDEADHLFDSVLADVLGKHGAYEFVMSKAAQCPNCKTLLDEKSLVERGGIEVDSIA